MIFNMVGGGVGGAGGGATLVVSSPANVSVTVSKDDKSYTKNSGDLGSTTFKGLATGTWTVVISGNGQTATRTIEITADYAITIAFFSATINITYPANSTCVVTNSGGQTVASDSNTGTSTKTWTATVNATGTYTVTATATDGSGRSKSQNVSITADGQSVTLNLNYLVPGEYQAVEYIESTGAQYIDTGIKLSTYYNVIAIELDAQYTYLSSGVLCGAYDGSFFMVSIVNSSTFQAQAGGGGSEKNITGSDTLRHIFGYNATTSKGYVDNTEVTLETVSLNENIWIFNYQAGDYAKARLYGCTISNGETLLREFIPCYRKSDSVAGLWDRVNKVFYTNAGTGVFIVGEAI